MEIIDEDDHIYRQTIELAKQSGLNFQPIKTVEEKLQEISATSADTSEPEETEEINTPPVMDVDVSIPIDENDQINMFDDNLNPVKPPVDIYTIPLVLAKDCWETPKYIKDYIYNRFGIDGYMFDPCPANPTRNGLLIEWEKCSYVNPPYSKPEQPCDDVCVKKQCKERGFCIDEYKPGQLDWVKKAVEESQKGKDVFMLIPSDTSTKIWNDWVMKYAYCVYFVKGRIKFVGAKGMPKFGNALVHFNGTTLGTVVCETIDFKE